MTGSSARPRGSSPARLVALAGAALAGGLAGAWLDWYQWHPSSAIVTTMAFVLLLVVGGIGWIIRSRRARFTGGLLVAVGAGGLVGQLAGPARPPTFPTETGSIRLTLSSGSTLDAAGDATCSLTADGSQIVVAPGEFGLARTTDEADFHYVHIRIGDMWDFGDRHARSDHLGLTIRVVKPILPDTGVPSEAEHQTDPASTVALGPTTSAGGSMTFANLVIVAGSGDGPRSDLAGTVSWTCGPALG